MIINHYLIIIIELIGFIVITKKYDISVLMPFLLQIRSFWFVLNSTGTQCESCPQHSGHYLLDSESLTSKYKLCQCSLHFSASKCLNLCLSLGGWLKSARQTPDCCNIITETSHQICHFSLRSPLSIMANGTVWLHRGLSDSNIRSSMSQRM